MIPRRAFHILLFTVAAVVVALGLSACASDAPDTVTGGPGVEVPAASGFGSIPAAVGGEGNGGGVSGGGSGMGSVQ